MSEIGTEVKTLLAEGEADVVAVAKQGWTTIEATLSAMEPTLKADLQAVLKEVEVDVEGGDTVDSLVTDVLNVAESSGKSAVIGLGTNLLSGLVAMLIADL